jgi:hypothetical protein
VSLDILEEAQGWLENPNSVCDVRPEVSGVILAESLPGRGERLTRIPAREDVHLSSKAFPREGFKIRPDRCWVQDSRFHFRDQIRAGKGFDLTKSDCAEIWDCSFKSEINASVSGAKADVSCLGSIHIFISLFKAVVIRAVLTLNHNSYDDSDQESESGAY